MRLLKRGGWTPGRRGLHGRFFSRASPDGRVRQTTVPDKRRPLAPGTLAAILGPLQTDLGREGLATLIREHGLT